MTESSGEPSRRAFDFEEQPLALLRGERPGLRRARLGDAAVGGAGTRQASALAVAGDDLGELADDDASGCPAAAARRRRAARGNARPRRGVGGALTLHRLRRAEVDALDADRRSRCRAARRAGRRR